MNSYDPHEFIPQYCRHSRFRTVGRAAKYRPYPAEPQLLSIPISLQSVAVVHCSSLWTRFCVFICTVTGPSVTNEDVPGPPRSGTGHFCSCLPPTCLLSVRLVSDTEPVQDSSISSSSGEAVSNDNLMAETSRPGYYNIVCLTACYRFAIAWLGISNVTKCFFFSKYTG